MPRHRAAWNSGHSARILQHRAFPCRSIAGEGGMWWSVAWAGAVTLSRVRGGPSVWQCCLPPSPARTYPGTAVPEKRTPPAPPPPEGRHLPGCDVKKHPYDVPGGCHGNSVMSQRSESLRVDGRGVEGGGGGKRTRRTRPNFPHRTPSGRAELKSESAFHRAPSTVVSGHAVRASADPSPVPFPGDRRCPHPGGGSGSCWLRGERPASRPQLRREANFGAGTGSPALPAVPGTRCPPVAALTLAEHRGAGAGRGLPARR